MKPLQIKIARWVIGRGVEVYTFGVGHTLEWHYDFHSKEEM